MSKQMHNWTARDKYAHAYHIIRTGRDISWSEMLALGRAATYAAGEAYRQRDGRCNVAPIADRLAEHKFMREFFA